jgi:hypothetical protein
MSIRLSSPQQLSLRTALVLAVTAVGFTAFTASASANFTLSTGTVLLTNGSTTGTPPTTGSWVRLPEDATEGKGQGTFINAASEAANHEYTLVKGSASKPGLELGAIQVGEEDIFGPLTKFGPTIAESVTFYAFTKAAPELTFAGKDNEAGTRNLSSGTLPVWIEYGGQEYDVDATTSGKPKSKYIVLLKGTIKGDATKAGATITLEWTTHIEQAPFNPYDAEFKWVGTYTP